jgi:hypothetical protein
MSQPIRTKPLTCGFRVWTPLQSARSPQDFQRSIDGGPGAVLRVGPQVAVGVEGLRGAGMPESSLDGLDRFAVPDQQAGVVVAQVVGAGTGRQPHRCHDRSPDVSEPLPGPGFALAVEDQTSELACAEG